jgi:protein phosphatase
VGDLVDRGPNTPAVLRLVMSMVEAGNAICVPGNHDDKLLRKLQGRDVQIAHGLAESLAQLDGESSEFKEQVINFLDGLVSHYVLDNGKLVVAHAGMKTEMQGRSSRRVRDFALYGETTGEVDEFSLPIRYKWAADYRGKAMVVYGHTPVPEAEWLNNTINIDTGCVFGGKLTALRYPERELVSVPAARVYSEPIRPLHVEQPVAAPSAQHEHDDVLHVQDVLGKRMVETRLHGNVTIREENAIAAFEVMNRFAVDSRWLIYLPPTMSPSETSALPALLEHPAEAFAYYHKQGVAQVVCQEKHMGSRAVVIVSRDQAAARQRFGVTDGSSAVCYTRTGRRFFTDDTLEHALFERLRAALDAANFWHQFDTDWVCLDCELLPWSAKAQELLRGRRKFGAAAHTSMRQAVHLFDQAAARGLDVAALRDRFNQRAHMVEDYIAAYRRYCWPVAGLDDLRLAPFHVLATEGAVHTDKDHGWHMRTLAHLCAADERLLLTTTYLEVDDNLS